MVPERVRAGSVAAVVAALLAWAPAAAAKPRFVPPGTIRPPTVTTNMDTNPANLASAVLTHAFGQLPDFIDGASIRLLPYDVYRAFEPGRTVARTYRVTTPRTGLVLDAASVSGLTVSEALANARQYAVAVTLDGLLVPNPERYWVAYRNNGPQICRIYFPGDLGSLNMRVNSLVLRPLPAGTHVLHVTVTQHAPGLRTGRIRTTYVLRVLPRKPNKAEVASAPDDDAPKPGDNTPLTFRPPGR